MAKVRLFHRLLNFFAQPCKYIIFYEIATIFSIGFEKQNKSFLRQMLWHQKDCRLQPKVICKLLNLLRLKFVLFRRKKIDAGRARKRLNKF